MLEYAFMQNALLVSVLISLMCPMIGMFLVLRRYSMIGDTLAHASLAGVAVGLLVKVNPIISAFAVTSVFAVLIEVLRQRFRRYAELILVIILSLSVGIAITIISSGSILTVTPDDVLAVAVLCVVSLAAVYLLYPQLVMLAFDEDGAKIAGVKTRLINYIFALLVAAMVAVSIRVVGILVISSLIALPVAAALQLGKGFKVTMLAAMVLSFIAIITGLVTSYWLGAAPGGVTALVSVALLLMIIIYKEIRAVL